jgi:DNA-binding transcriptional LysR family regulator
VEWSDLRFFLAAARAGSLGGAARELGVEHTTVGRRLAALEETLGAKLFVRTPDGLTLTPEGREVVPLAETVERTTQAIERAASARDGRIEGTVRVTTSEAFSGFLVKRLTELRARHPALVIEVLMGNQSLDLARGEADIAIRAMKTTQRDLIVKKLADAGWSLYGATGYLARRGTPARVDDLAGHDVVGYDDAMSGVPGAQWLDANARGANLVLRGNSLVSVVNAVIAGLGISVVPCFLGDSEPTLQRLTPDVLGTREITLVVHPDMAKVARVRAVMDYIIEIARRDRAPISGRAPPEGAIPRSHGGRTNGDPGG